MMSSLPNFYKLLVEEECPICKEKFLLTTYPKVEVDNAIIFYKNCYSHPCHANCSLAYYESIDPNQQQKCVVCREELRNLDGVIMTPMLPPSEEVDELLPSSEDVDELLPPSEDVDELLPPSEDVDELLPPSEDVDELLPPSEDVDHELLPPSEDVDHELLPPSEDVDELLPPSEDVDHELLPP